MSEQKVNYLRNYKPCPFVVEDIKLTIDIYPEVTKVINKLEVKKNINANDKNAFLELNGEELEFKSVKVNGEILNGSQFTLSSDKLVIHFIPSDKFDVEIENWIYPEKNTALEGFYRSGNVLCTQCEPEGFRKITYFLDRPDNMSKFQTTLIADAKLYPQLLSNGNKVKETVENGRRTVVWVDPFKKPSYLFAIVAGDLEMLADTYTTTSGRIVKLEIFVDPGNLFKAPHAMQSLKESMKWDEDTYGLEYDLDIYMIVAVDSFNMGAMENKGLNIFNSTYVLADPKTATDVDFANVQAVIGHEYFHNWTGNRVTCKNWFQLTLKEGLTVFRDQEFSSDMLSRDVKRIEDVKRLKELQFPEDAGPLSHPIRPSSYVEMNNFYTATVYEKGAEVIRMIQTLIGGENFKKGMKKYFELFDGQAVTTEDFVQAMEFASSKDLSQFKNWYSRAGTPTIKLSTNFDESNKELNIDYEQVYPSVKIDNDLANVLHFPFVISFYTQSGKKMDTRLFEVKEMKGRFAIKLQEKPFTISLNENFSAPVIVEYPYSNAEVLFLCRHAQDGYARSEAFNILWKELIFKNLNQDKIQYPEGFNEMISDLILDTKIDYSLKSFLFEIPSIGELTTDAHTPDFDAITLVRGKIYQDIASNFYDNLYSQFRVLADKNTDEISSHGYAHRSMKNMFQYILSKHPQRKLNDDIYKEFQIAKTMTDELSAMKQMIEVAHPYAEKALIQFKEKWKHDSLVMLKWFGAQSTCVKLNAVELLKNLEQDECFKKQVPNYLRSLYHNFAKSNLTNFHKIDGSGYAFIKDKILEIDEFNPQMASRLATSFSMVARVDKKRQELMLLNLNEIKAKVKSKDTLEIVNKFLIGN